MICKIIGHRIVVRETHKCGEIGINVLICSRCGKTFKMKNKLAEVIQDQIVEGETYLKEVWANMMPKNVGLSEVNMGAALEYGEIEHINNIRSQIGILKHVLIRWKELK